MTDASEILHSFTAEVSEEQNLPHLRQSDITPTASEAMRYSSIFNFSILHLNSGKSRIIKLYYKSNINGSHIWQVDSW